MVHKDELTAKVAAVNAANKAANELFPVLANVFRPLVGQNITKNDHTLLARIIKLLPEFPALPGLSVYGKASEHKYNLHFTVKVCEKYGDGCTYYEVGVYIADLTNGVITRIYDAPSHITDHSVEKVLEKRKVAEAARKAYDEAKSDLSPFSEW